MLLPLLLFWYSCLKIQPVALEFFQGERLLCLNRLNVFELLCMKLFQCLSAFKPTFWQVYLKLNRTILLEKVYNWNSVNFVETFKVIVGRWKHAASRNSPALWMKHQHTDLPFHLCFLYADSFLHIQLWKQSRS